MDNLSNLVHKKHDTFLEHLSRIRELSDITEAEDCNALMTWQQWINIISHLHVLCDNLRTSFPKTNREQSSNLIECALQDFSLEGCLTFLDLLVSCHFSCNLVLLLLLDSVFLCLLGSFNRVFGDHFDFRDHIFDRAQHQVLSHFREQERASSQHDTDGQSGDHAQDSSSLGQFT